MISHNKEKRTEEFKEREKMLKCYPRNTHNLETSIRTYISNKYYSLDIS